MTQSSRVQIALVRETTVGTTPNTPRMRLMRMTGEQLTFAPSFVDTAEIRSDRMTTAPIMVMKEGGGSVNAALSWPNDNSPLSEIIRSAFYNTWTNTPARDNDGVAASVITGLTTAGTVATVVTGAAFVANQLVRFTGFGVANNNGVFKCTTGSATVPAFVGSGITDEASPAAAARMKVVGVVGASGDITATATGLGSTALNWTLMGLAVGQWVKIGGTAAGDKFATAALNDWARITAIAATALTLDNLPTGWTTDTGAGKTIKVWFGDQIKNGTTQTGMTIERGYLGQASPTYIVNKGMVVDSLAVTAQSRQKLSLVAAFKGMNATESTSALSGSPDAITTGAVMAANANVGRLAENGSQLISPNWAKELDFTIANNLRPIDAVDATSPVAIREGECHVSGTIKTLFGNDTLLAKFYAGTASAINSRFTTASQALVWQFPTITYNGGGNPNATGPSIDVELSLSWKASYDALTAAHALLDRLEYYES